MFHHGNTHFTATAYSQWRRPAQWSAYSWPTWPLLCNSILHNLYQFYTMVIIMIIIIIIITSPCRIISNFNLWGVPHSREVGDFPWFCYFDAMIMIMIIMVIYSRTHRYLGLFPIPCAFSLYFLLLLLHGIASSTHVPHNSIYALMLPGPPTPDSVFLEAACGKDDLVWKKESFADRQRLLTDQVSLSFP